MGWQWRNQDSRMVTLQHFRLKCLTSKKVVVSNASTCSSSVAGLSYWFGVVGKRVRRRDPRSSHPSAPESQHQTQETHAEEEEQRGRTDPGGTEVIEQFKGQTADRQESIGETERRRKCVPSAALLTQSPSEFTRELSPTHGARQQNRC